MPNTIDHALNFDYDSMGWGEPKMSHLDAMTIDHNFTSDVRMLLIEAGPDFSPSFDLRAFLEDLADYRDTGEPAPRYLDLRRYYMTLVDAAANYGRDEISHLAMQHSLCPVHYVDWAICFDDEDPECAQIRAIFPHGHDT